MSEDKKRSTILDSISDWLKLFGLIILVAEAIITIAMTQTESSNPIYPFYPFIMIFLLLFIVIAVFIDRFNERKTNNLSIKVEEKKLNINSDAIYATSLIEGNKMYTNSMLGYYFKRPIGEGWREPKDISYTDYIKELYMNNEIDEGSVKNIVTSNSPFGNLIFKSKILEIQQGNSVIISFDEETTTDTVEYAISKKLESLRIEGIEYSEEDIKKLRQELNQTDSITKINFAVKLTIMVLDKNDLDNNAMPLGLPNLFLTLSLASQEPIDSIVSNEGSILWTTSNKLKNVLINYERFNSVNIYRLYQLIQNNNKFYFITVQWSPQIQMNVNAWDKLKEAFESFRIISNLT